MNEEKIKETKPLEIKNMTLYGTIRFDGATIEQIIKYVEKAKDQIDFGDYAGAKDTLTVLKEKLEKEVVVTQY